MEVELYVSLSPEGLSTRRRKKIAEWVKELKKSLGGRVNKLEVRIVSETKDYDVKNKGDEK